MADTNFTTPVGRLVAGSLYKGQDKDAEGRPLVVKSGPNAGQPRLDYYFAIAIPKAGEQHWAQTAWGALIWQTGHGAFPQGQGNAPTFAWKVTDGDSQVPNRAGKKPCDREGWRGCWVLHFSSGYAPKIYNRDGTAAIVEPDAVKLGYYIQVNGNVAGNESMQQPGVFLNHKMVALSAYGEEIFVGPDPSAAGFGASPLPAGAMATPPASFTPPATPVAPAPAAGGYPPPPGAVAAPPAVTVTPNHGFVAGPGGTPAVPGVPGVPGAAVPPPPAAAAPARVMLPAAQGAAYEQLIAAGWNDALLVQHGMMAP